MSQRKDDAGVDADADADRPTTMPTQDAIDFDLQLQRFANFRKVVGGFTTLAYGHAGKGKVLYYDLGALVRKGAFHTVFATKASIFTMDSSLAKSQILYLFWFSACAAISYLFVPDQHLRGMQELEKFTNYWNVFIPFILGLYIALNISRWWTLRTDGVGIVLDAAQNVVLLMNGVFPGAGWADVHDQVLKYGLASVSLIVNACRGIEDIDSLGPKGDNLLSPEEIEVLIDVPYRARPVLMWTWILMLLSKVCDENGINPGKFRDVAAECKKARNGISVIWSYLRTQLPFAYVHLVTFMVNLNNFFVSVKCGILFALALKQNEHSRALNQFFFICIVPPLYQALLTISFIIHDPFGEDLLDFPIMAFQEYMNEAAVSMSAMGHRCPALKKTSLWLGSPSMTKDQDGLEDLSYLGGPNGMGGMADGAVGLIEREFEMESIIQETVLKLEKSMVAQVEAKDDVIFMLRERAKWLESTMAGQVGRLEMLESRLAVVSSSSDGPAVGNGWCAVQRADDQPVGIRPVAMAPDGLALPPPPTFSQN